MEENKGYICTLLYDVLRATRAGHDITEVTYIAEDGNEYALIKGKYWAKKVDITADSGIALCRDVLRAL